MPITSFSSRIHRDLYFRQTDCGVTRRRHSHLVIEEVDRVRVQLQRERLQKGDVVGHHLLVGEVKLVHDDRVDVVVGEQVV